MARLERHSKRPTSAPIALATQDIPRALWDAYSIAMAQYLPAPLEVPVVFYAAEHDGHGWGYLSSRLEVSQVPGGHHGCLTIGAELLVCHLRRTIDALADGAASIN
jgi:oxalate---CoA ligase